MPKNKPFNINKLDVDAPKTLKGFKESAEKLQKELVDLCEMFDKIMADPPPMSEYLTYEIIQNRGIAVDCAITKTSNGNNGFLEDIVKLVDEYQTGKLKNWPRTTTNIYVKDTYKQAVEAKSKLEKFSKDKILAEAVKKAKK